MVDHDELLDAAAAEANRRDIRRAVAMTVVSGVLVVLASLLVIAGGIGA